MFCIQEQKHKTKLHQEKLCPVPLQVDCSWMTTNPCKEMRFEPGVHMNCLPRSLGHEITLHQYYTAHCSKVSICYY